MSTTHPNSDVRVRSPGRHKRNSGRCQDSVQAKTVVQKTLTVPHKDSLHPLPVSCIHPLALCAWLLACSRRLPWVLTLAERWATWELTLARLAFDQ